MSSDDSRAPEPTNCPFCQSAKVTTADRKRPAGAYWRCESCGQLWHPERLTAAGGGSRGSFR